MKTGFNLVREEPTQPSNEEIQMTAIVASFMENGPKIAETYVNHCGRSTIFAEDIKLASCMRL